VKENEARGMSAMVIMLMKVEAARLKGLGLSREVI
jgi:hypothetical protein